MKTETAGGWWIAFYWLCEGVPEGQMLDLSLLFISFTYTGDLNFFPLLKPVNVLFRDICTCRGNRNSLERPNLLTKGRSAPGVSLTLMQM